MAIITKVSKSAAAADRKQLYTWAACAFIGILVLSIAIPVMNGGEDSAESYKNKAYDLAGLPFIDDAAEQALLKQEAYSDIPKDDLLGSLYSKKDKEERQLSDEQSGLPAPPDEEYKAASIERDRQSYKQSSRNSYKSNKSNDKSYTPTKKGSLSTGSMARSTGSNSGIKSNIWTTDKSNTKNTGGASSSQSQKAQLLASIGKGGRVSGFSDASLLSGKAANSKDAEAASAAAIDAFNNKNPNADLNSNLEKDKDSLGGLDIGKMDAALGKSSGKLGDLEKKVEYAKKEQQNANQGACPNGLLGSGGNFMDCILNPFVDKLVDGFSTRLTDGFMDKLFGDGKDDWVYADGHLYNKKNGETKSLSEEKKK
jgi:hypothetical protein